jgi:hypothetical protein
MGYWVRVVLGVALIVGGVAVFGYSTYQLVDIGTCASGGPYVSARECPEGTGTLIVSMFPATLLTLVGVGLFASRGGRATAPGLPPTA